VFVQSNVKSWINLNYKYNRFICRIEFLKLCKKFSVFPKHLSNISESKFHFKEFKSKDKLDKLLYNTKHKILNIEIFDLHKQLYNSSFNKSVG